MPASAARPAPTCIAEAGIARVVDRASRIPTRAPPARASRGLREAGIEVKLGVGAERGARVSMAGFFTRLALGRPRITLKLALSIDGKIALPSGECKWITGEDARAHVHLERAHSDMILVGRGTYLADRAAARRAPAGARGHGRRAARC